MKMNDGIDYATFYEFHNNVFTATKDAVTEYLSNNFKFREPHHSELYHVYRQIAKIAGETLMQPDDFAVKFRNYFKDNV